MVWVYNKLKSYFCFFITFINVYLYVVTGAGHLAPFFAGHPDRPGPNQQSFATLPGTLGGPQAAVSVEVQHLPLNRRGFGHVDLQ